MPALYRHADPGEIVLEVGIREYPAIEIVHYRRRSCVPTETLIQV